MSVHVFYHNSWPNVKILLELEREGVPHPLHFPDKTQTNYLALQQRNYLKNKMFAIGIELKTAIENFIDNKPVKFYTKSIHHLLHDWKQLQNNGDYIADWLFLLMVHFFIVFCDWQQKLCENLVFNQMYLGGNNLILNKF